MSEADLRDAIVELLSAGPKLWADLRVDLARLGMPLEGFPDLMIRLEEEGVTVGAWEVKPDQGHPTIFRRARLARPGR